VFTGLVEELGRLVERRGERFTFGAAGVLDDLGPGDSVAVNGACLTVVELGPGCFATQVVAETLDRTTLGSLAVGDPVNLERPLRLGERLGGHLVQGHVDGVGTVVVAAPDLEVAAGEAILRYVAEKGSVAVDGVSLTVAGVGRGSFRVAVVPHTEAVTTLGRRRPGDRVNLEVDVVAKYVERLGRFTRD